MCVITFNNTSDRVRVGLRSRDQIWVRDNTDDNIGFSRAANELARRGTDSLILFVNPDGDPLPDCFDLLEACFEDAGVVAAAARESDSTLPPDRDWLTGACLAVRRRAFEEVGGFDESLFMYGEDVDLSWKLARLGRLVLCQQAVFIHDQHSRGWLAAFRMVRNELLVRKRWNKPSSTLRVAHYGLYNCRQGMWLLGTARLAGLASFLTIDALGKWRLRSWVGGGDPRHH